MRRLGLRLRERGIELSLLACALVTILVTAGIIFVLLDECFGLTPGKVGFFQAVSISEFLTGTEWKPMIEPRSFGVLPLVSGTLMVAFGALLVALPIGLATSIFLSEYAPPWLRQIFKPVLELLAGVPTVVYGYFALTFITPYLIRGIFPDVQIFNALSAAVVVGIMIVPTVCSLCDDAFRAVPRSLREAAYGLAATKLEVSTRVVLPAALSGVIAAVLLAFSRAIGETMAVALAAGMTPHLSLNPLTSIQTMTGYIVQVVGGDAPAGSLEYQTIFAVGLSLFAMTFIVNVVAQRIFARFREAYE
ncbi:MAG: phosphate ABC transporter permease subunit PstC [Planctomycetia bacterium]|nr:MAG: phosphate ABC transporter permease subunit PstC [Planctomycetia bacterium]